MKFLSRSEIAALLLAAFILIVSAIFGIWANTQNVPASAIKGFDHSNCQYPDRWSNPPTGCDNSDPAVPECIKAFSTQQGEKDCIEAFVAAQRKPVIVPAEITPAPIEAEFGGK